MIIFSTKCIFKVFTKFLSVYLRLSTTLSNDLRSWWITVGAEVLFLKATVL